MAIRLGKPLICATYILISVSMCFVDSASAKGDAQKGSSKQSSMKVDNKAAKQDAKAEAKAAKQALNAQKAVEKSAAKAAKKPVSNSQNISVDVDTVINNVTDVIIGNEVQAIYSVEEVFPELSVINNIIEPNRNIISTVNDNKVKNSYLNYHEQPVEKLDFYKQGDFYLLFHEVIGNIEYLTNYTHNSGELVVDIFGENGGGFVYVTVSPSSSVEHPYNSVKYNAIKLDWKNLAANIRYTDQGELELVPSM